MRSYFCGQLDTNVNLICKEQGEDLEVLLFDTDNGVLLFPITIPFSSSRKFCAYVNTYEYPWLYEFLVDNDIALPTYRFRIYKGHRCEEFNFLEEILDEK